MTFAPAERSLWRAAKAARRFAQCRFSNFAVGAALATPKSKVYRGCNIENASFGLTVCAERVALLKALSEGDTVFAHLAIVADTDEPTPPCGACRQLLWEYCGDLPILLGNLKGPVARHHLGALLPYPFDAGLL